MKDYNEIIKTTNHNHIKSDKDAVEPEKTMFDAFIEAGYTSIGITDHGCFTGMQTMLDFAKEKNVKILYGCEIYVEIPKFDTDNDLSVFKASKHSAHMILYAKNEEGKHILDKLVSKAKETGNVGQPVVLFEDLIKAAKTNTLVCTTACINGIPSFYLRENSLNLKKIDKINNTRNLLMETIKDGEVLPEIIAPDNNDYQTINNTVNNIEDEIVNLKKQLSDENIKEQIKSLKAQLRIEKKLGNEQNYLTIQQKLEKIDNDMISIKESIKAKTYLLKSKKEVLANYKKRVDKWQKIEDNISNIKKELRDEKEQIVKAKRSIVYLKKSFGEDNFFIEVQNHGMEEEKFCYQTLAEIANELNIPLIAANDSHMAYNSESSLNKRNVARFLRFKKIEESDADKELYVKTPNELAEALLKILNEKQVDEAMMNLLKLDELCNFEPVYTPHYPVYDKTKDSNELIREIAYQNIEKKYPDKKKWDKQREERLEYELDTIISMGFSDYFLIVKDFIEYGTLCSMVPLDKLNEAPYTIAEIKEFIKANGWTTKVKSPGRGSGAGSLVTYLLGITNIDPFDYDLLFERFLNPERVTMPDIDTDFPFGIREKVIEYVKKKYGYNAVVGIVTETRQGVKGSIRDASRYLGAKDGKIYLQLDTSIRKKIITSPNLTWDTIEDNGKTVYENILNDFSNNPDALRIIKLAKDLEGMLCGYGQHAAGVIIYDNEDITDYIPTRKGKLGRTTECDMVQAEAINLLKMDFLGLKTLNILLDTLRLIKKNYGKDVDLDKIPVEGPEAQLVYKDIFAKGRTKNVFQFESAGMRKYLKELMAK